jgi:hypothetical protein
MCFTPWDDTLRDSFIRYTLAERCHSWVDAQLNVFFLSLYLSFFFPSVSSKYKIKLFFYLKLTCPTLPFFRETGCCLLYTNMNPMERRKKEMLVGCHAEICLEYIMKWTSQIQANRCQPSCHVINDG